MMKISKLFFLLILIFSVVVSKAQKSISEGTLIYNINIVSLKNEPIANALIGASVTVYLKGGLSRTDMVSSLGMEKTIHDAKTGAAVILKEYSGQKLMITLSKENWEEKNKKSEGLVFVKQNETKEILGYSCTKANTKLKDGTSVAVFYTKDLSINNKDYDPTFMNLDGVPLQYEFESEKIKFVYTISKIDFNSLPIAKFDFPKMGYRVMTYNENKAGKKSSL